MELSIEEKAKAYDEAIKRGKQIQTTPYTAHWDIMKEVAEHLLPELKKGESERIRKELIQYLKECNNLPNGQYCRADFFAWLEKQGERKPADKVEPKFKVGDVVTNKKSKDTVKIVQILHDSYCYSCWDGAATVHSDFSISEQDGWELVEQKPAEWSDDDEKRMNHIIQFLENKDRWKDSERAFPIEEDIRWLKSLKDRVGYEANCTTTKEWSEEDETTKNNISHIISQYDKISKKENQPCWYVGDCLLWIQNIKDRVQPQNTWKPSEKQIEAVRIAAEIGTANNSWAMGILNSLYQDLKKLREE